MVSISQIESKIKSLQAEITRLNRQNTEEAKKEAKAQETLSLMSELASQNAPASAQ